MVGRTVEELLGRCIWDVFPDAIGNQYYRELHEARALQKPIRSEHYYEPWARWFENSIYPSEDGVTVLTLDITERKRVQLALHASEAQLSIALHGASAGVWRLKIASGEAFWSEEFALLYGYDAGTSRSFASWMESVHSEDRERVESELRQSFSNGDSQFQREFRIIHPQRGARWILAVSRIERDSQGRATDLVGIHLDITARRRAEDSLRSLLQLSSRLNATLDVDELLDVLVAGAISFVNAESGVAGLYTPAGMVCRKYLQRGKTLPLEYCWPAMRGLPGWLIVHKRPYLTNDAASDTQIVRELCVQFGVRSALSTPILDAQREPLGFFELHNKQGGFSTEDSERLTVISDIAAIAVQNALAYRRLREAQQSLEAADRRKDEFLAILAHELRNPLAPLRNGLDIARLTAEPDSPLQRTVSMMDRQLNHLVRLVDDLLDLSRISGGKVDLRRQPLLLSAVLASSVESRRADIESRGQELAIDVRADSLAVEGDFDRLAQVFSNLLSNSAKYTARGGRIMVTLEQEDDHAVVKITDTGVGIRPEDIERVFDMFSQVREHEGRNEGGLGIGLSLVRTLTSMHGGTATAESAGPGKGSTFIVRLPRFAGGLPEAAPAERSTEAASGMRVLVVDDNTDAADSLAEVLALQGHRVLTAASGLQALEHVQSFRPHVIFMDIGMPEMDGLEAARRIRGLPQGRDVVIAALTGWGQQADRERTFSAGIDRHLVKPVSVETLLEFLAAIDAVSRVRGHDAGSPRAEPRKLERNF